MSDVFQYNPSTGAGIQYINSAHTQDFENKAGYYINPDKALMSSVRAEYVKMSGGVPVEMSGAEKSAVDAAKPVIPPVPDIYRIERQVIEHEDRIRTLENGAK
jgi:hypothetical protein